MPDLTQEQADQLADDTLALRIAVNKFRGRFFDTLTPEQRDGLLSLSLRLGDEVDHLTAVATRLTLAKVQEAIGHIREITGQVNEAAAHLSDLSKMITIAASLVDLGAAIASENPGAVMLALRNTASTVKG